MTRTELQRLGRILRRELPGNKTTITWAARQALEMYAKGGESYDTIATQTGVVVSTVRYYLLRWFAGYYQDPALAPLVNKARRRLLTNPYRRSLENRRMKYDARTWERNLRKIANGRKTVREIAEALAVQPCVVYQHALVEIAGLGLSGGAVAKP